MEPVVESKEGYLKVTNTADRHAFSEVLEGVNMIAGAMDAYGMNFALIDHSTVNYHLPVTKAFDLVKVFEINLPDFRGYTIAVLTNEANLEVARFWESICKRRGFSMRVFLCEGEAMTWLKRQMALAPAVRRA